MRNEALLDEVIASKIEELREEATGTDQHKAKVDDVAKLLDRSIEMKKAELDADAKAEDREYDKQLRLQQLADDKEDRRNKDIITIGTCLFSAGVTIGCFLKSLKFEEVGTVTTTAGREFLKSAMNLFKRR